MAKYNPMMPSETYDVADLKAIQASNILAGMEDNERMHFDSGEDAAIFFARELDYIKSKSYDKEYPELTAMKHFPITSETDPGAESITYYSYDKVGLAKIIRDYATDLPRADVKGEPTTVPVKGLGDSYGYSVQEMRASRMAGKSLDVRKAESAKYQIDYLFNKIAFIGDSANKLVGVLSTTNDVPTYTLPNGAGGVADWLHKTPDEILADVTGFQKQMVNVTKNVERPDTMLLPPSVYIDISTRRLTDTGKSIKTYLLENNPYIKTIDEAPELEADAIETNPYASLTPGSGQGVALIYKKDPDKFSIENPMPFYQHPAQAKGLEIIIPCEARVAGAILYYPLSLMIVPGISKN